MAEALQRVPRARRLRPLGGPQVFCRASQAQGAAEAEPSDARRGIGDAEEGAARKASVIGSGMARGLSPEQICATHPDPGIPKSTVHEWADRGCGEMSNMGLRRKVGYRPRRHAGGGRPTRHSARRSHDAFSALPEDVRESAWEMGAAVGGRTDTRCLLTLYHRPTSSGWPCPQRPRPATRRSPGWGSSVFVNVVIAGLST